MVELSIKTKNQFHCSNSWPTGRDGERWVQISSTCSYEPFVSIHMNSVLIELTLGGWAITNCCIIKSLRGLVILVETSYWEAAIIAALTIPKPFRRQGRESNSHSLVEQEQWPVEGMSSNIQHLQEVYIKDSSHPIYPATNHSMSKSTVSSMVPSSSSTS